MPLSRAQRIEAKKRQRKLLKQRKKASENQNNNTEKTPPPVPKKKNKNKSKKRAEKREDPSNDVEHTEELNLTEEERVKRAEKEWEKANPWYREAKKTKTSANRQQTTKEMYGNIKDYVHARRKPSLVDKYKKSKRSRHFESSGRVQDILEERAENVEHDYDKLKETIPKQKKLIKAWILTMEANEEETEGHFVLRPGYIWKKDITASLTTAIPFFVGKICKKIVKRGRILVSDSDSWRQVEAKRSSDYDLEKYVLSVQALDPLLVFDLNSQLTRNEVDDVVVRPQHLHRLIEHDTKRWWLQNLVNHSEHYVNAINLRTLERGWVLRQNISDWSEYRWIQQGEEDGYSRISKAQKVSNLEKQAEKEVDPYKEDSYLSSSDEGYGDDSYTGSATQSFYGGHTFSSPTLQTLSKRYKKQFVTLDTINGNLRHVAQSGGPMATQHQIRYIEQNAPMLEHYLGMRLSFPTTSLQDQQTFVSNVLTLTDRRQRGLWSRAYQQMTKYKNLSGGFRVRKR